jgi:hypothetical protein
VRDAIVRKVHEGLLSETLKDTFSVIEFPPSGRYPLGSVLKSTGEKNTPHLRVTAPVEALETEVWLRSRNSTLRGVAVVSCKS